MIKNALALQVLQSNSISNVQLNNKGITGLIRKYHS